MAYRATGTTSLELYNNMKEFGLLKSTKVEEVLKKVDRSLFYPRKSTDQLRDAPETLGFNVTISAPHMHAFALENLENHIVPNSTILDIGSGSGYLTLFIGIEHVNELVCMSQLNIRRAGFQHLLDNGTIEIIKGDGRLGYKEASPFDAIHIGAGAEEIPQILIDQLKPNGRMILPVDNEVGTQDYMQVDKDKETGQVSYQKLMTCSFVPLTDLNKQLTKKRRKNTPA